MNKISTKGIYHGFIKNKIPLICAPVNYESTKDALIDARLVYYYLVIKITDLLDTVSFFVVIKSIPEILIIFSIV
jgi:elongation of very long chain fatty acids protein 7